MNLDPDRLYRIFSNERSPDCWPPSRAEWQNLKPASMTPSRLISTGRAGNFAPRVSEPDRAGKQIERCVISTFQIAESMGFKGELRHCK